MNIHDKSMKTILTQTKKCPKFVQFRNLRFFFFLKKKTRNQVLMLITTQLGKRPIVIRIGFQLLLTN
ncbi:hypothetical protein Hanom_Chr12g01075801 [Helianthus anomalus]